MTLVEFYTRDDCPLCDEGRMLLQRIRTQLPFRLREIHVLPGEDLFEEYKDDFPLVFINKRFAFKHRLHEHLLRMKLQQVLADQGPSPDAGPDDSEIVR